MGLLADHAKQQSKFLQLDIGESVVVDFLDFKFIPSNLDPSQEVVQYKLRQDGKDKYWTNSSAKVQKVLDSVPKGSPIRIKRDPWLDKNGNIVPGKSSWSVEKV